MKKLRPYADLLNQFCILTKPLDHSYVNKLLLLCILLWLFSHFLLLFKYSWLHFPPITLPTPAIPTYPWSHPTLVLSLCPLYMFLKTFPSYPPITSPTSPPVTVNLFLISVSLVKFFRSTKLDKMRRWTKWVAGWHTALLGVRADRPDSRCVTVGTVDDLRALLAQMPPLCQSLREHEDGDNSVEIAWGREWRWKRW